MPTEYDTLTPGQLQLKIAQLEQSMEAEIKAIKLRYEKKLDEMREQLHRKQARESKGDKKKKVDKLVTPN